MVTYPSTHGVFEAAIGEICALVHERGGQVYLDGANLNALVGLAKPGKFGADVSHLNLHKTFCIPHGGGGPGVGPVGGARAPRAVPAEPPARADAGPATGVGRSAAPWGSAGHPADPVGVHADDGRRRPAPRRRRSRSSTPTTSRTRLAPHYPVLYTGRNGLVAHECILDLRPITKATGVTVDDVAKRLIDYGFHAPPCGMQNVLCRFRCDTSAPNRPGLGEPDQRVEVRPVDVHLTAGVVHLRAQLARCPSRTRRASTGTSP